MRRVIVELTDDLAKFLSEHFHTEDLAKIVKDLLDEGAIEIGLSMTGFKEITVREESSKC